MNSHAHCLLCGDRNPWSLGLQFHRDDHGAVCATFKADRRFQGYDWIVHGGVIAALLDAAMTHALFRENVQAVTGDLRVRFLHSISCGSRTDLRAWVLSSRSAIYRVRAELAHAGQLMAWAEAKFMVPGRPGMDGLLCSVEPE